MSESSSDDIAQADRRLHGPERVAALLLAMGKPLAERLLPHFDPAELREISRCAVALGRVPAAELEGLIEEFAGQFAAGLNLLVTAREFEDLLSGVMPPEPPFAAMAELPTFEEPAVWDRVSQLSEKVIADYLLEEHAQTVALIVAQLEPAKAAKVMTELPAGLRDDAMRRMLASGPATEAGLRIVADALEKDLLENAPRSDGPDPHKRLAQIINNMDRDDTETFLQTLGEAKPQSAEILKSYLFTFEDLSQVTPQARASLLDKVSSERLVLALKGTEAEFREVVLSALPSRSRRVVENELGRNEAVQQRDIAAARREIVDLALDLAGRGDIQLKAPPGQQSEQMVA
jgi:flagellar motor switch protein FliG